MPTSKSRFEDLPVVILGPLTVHMCVFLTLIVVSLSRRYFTAGNFLALMFSFRPVRCEHGTEDCNFSTKLLCAAAVAFWFIHCAWPGVQWDEGDASNINERT